MSIWQITCRNEKELLKLTAYYLVTWIKAALNFPTEYPAKKGFGKSSDIWMDFGKHARLRTFRHPFYIHEIIKL